LALAKLVGTGRRRGLADRSSLRLAKLVVQSSCSLSNDLGVDAE
jgi:hypothetical protein